MEQAAGGAATSCRLLDAICLIGPIDRCREQLAAVRAAGVDLPILMPPIGVEGARTVIQAFRRETAALASAGGSRTTAP